MAEITPQHVDDAVEILTARMKEGGTDWHQICRATKVVGGNDTGELCVQVAVEKKARYMPVEEDATLIVVPKTVKLDGASVLTDVVERPRVKALNLLPQPATKALTDRHRPAPGGVSCGHRQVTAGTLGFWCHTEKAPEGWYLVSNNHVIANTNEASPNDAILQPGSYDGGRYPEDRIAVLTEFAKINFGDGDDDTPPDLSCLAKCIAEGGGFFKILQCLFGCLLGNQSEARLRELTASIHFPEAGVLADINMRPDSIEQTTSTPWDVEPRAIEQDPNILDAAIAKALDPGWVEPGIWTGPDRIWVTPEGWDEDPQLGGAVWSTGRTSGLRRTLRVSGLNATIQVDYGAGKGIATFEKQVVLESASNGPPSQGGDSGSSVFDYRNRIVGLLFAGSNVQAIINPAQQLREAFGLVLED